MRRPGGKSLADGGHVDAGIRLGTGGSAVRRGHRQARGGACAADTRAQLDFD